MHESSNSLRLFARPARSNGEPIQHGRCLILFTGDSVDQSKFRQRWKSVMRHTFFHDMPTWKYKSSTTVSNIPPFTAATASSHYIRNVPPLIQSGQPHQLRPHLTVHSYHRDLHAERARGDIGLQGMDELLPALRKPALGCVKPEQMKCDLPDTSLRRRHSERVRSTSTRTWAPSSVRAYNWCTLSRSCSCGQRL